MPRNCYAKGRACRLERGETQVAYGYTGLGEIASIRQHIGSLEARLQYRYDALGRITRLTYPSGATLVHDWATSSG